MDFLKNKHKGQQVWIIGKGPSLQYLRKEDIGDGIVIALNQAIVPVESLGLPNVVYSMQKDGGDRRHFREDNLCPDCDYSNDCEDKCGNMVRPKSAILLLHDVESKYCYPDYPERHVLNLEKLGLPANVFSLVFAIKTAQFMGCTKINLVSCDAHAGENADMYVPGKGVIEKEHSPYRFQADVLKYFIEGLECQKITPQKQMKILVTAKYVSGAAHEGGSSRFMRTVIDALKAMGHSVTATNDPGPLADKTWDRIIVSHHDQLRAIKDNPARKIYISHGIIGDECMEPGADRYISISEEVRGYNRLYKIESEIIGQPIKIGKQARPGATLKKILIIRRPDPGQEDWFSFLSEKYEVRDSDIDEPIEDQIAWADLCITLGRGALEAMAQGKPVLVADNRDYIGAKGDGYVNKDNIREIARCNFSGRRFEAPITRGWIEAELAKYNPNDSDYLYAYAREHHDARKIVTQYLVERPDIKISFGVMVNDPLRLDMVLKQSELPKSLKCHRLDNPESATKGLNLLLEKCEEDGADVAILTHQDMFYRSGWLNQVKEQLRKLPDSWVAAGIIGKDMQGRIAGQFHDMRIPLDFNTMHLHEFPQPACCFDECCIIVNLKKGFRFDESYEGFDLYGTLVVLQTIEQGGTAWILDAFCEHYCLRNFSWAPDDLFVRNYKRLYDRCKTIRVDSTALGLPPDGELRFETSAARLSEEVTA
jgi:hypothetical protein